MESKLKNLRSSMDQTVLKKGTITKAEKKRIFDNAVNGKETHNNSFIGPILSVAVTIAFLFSIGLFTYKNLFPDKRPADISPPDISVDEANEKEIEVIIPTDQDEQPEKDWKDVTVLEHGANYDMPTNAKDYIASANTSIHQIPDPDSKLIQRGFDEMYYYYLEASSIQNGLNIIKVQGIDIEKDFNNLYNLTIIIYEEQHKRLDGVNIDGVSKFDAHKYWNEPTEDMKNALDFLQKLLNDLDIAINKDGQGEVFGYSYQGDGEKVTELQEFIDSYFGF